MTQALLFSYMGVSLKPTVANLRKLAAQHGGRVQSDGCGGLEVLAPPDRRWINGEVQCLILALSEYESREERRDEIERCMDMMAAGHELFPVNLDGGSIHGG
jgi:hypothetical protein